VTDAAAIAAANVLNRCPAFAVAAAVAAVAESVAAETDVSAVAASAVKLPSRVFLSLPSPLP
jgi:hypothetical protein